MTPVIFFTLFAVWRYLVYRGTLCNVLSPFTVVFITIPKCYFLLFEELVPSRLENCALVMFLFPHMLGVHPFHLKSSLTPQIFLANPRWFHGDNSAVAGWINVLIVLCEDCVALLTNGCVWWCAMIPRSIKSRRHHVTP